jgi:two-component system sensor histidine kinase CreC
MKIRTAIFTVYVAASAVGLAVLMRYNLAEVRPRYVASLQHNLADAARLLAVTWTGQPVPDATALRDAQAGLRVRLVAGDGALLLDTAEPALLAAESYEVSSARKLARRVGDNLIDGERDPKETEITATAPVTLAGGRTATLVLSRPIRGVNAIIWAERKKLAGMALVIAAVMVVAGWWLASRLTQSLERLTAYAQGVRDGRPTPPPISRATEIAALARAFEEMRDALEGRQHAERYTQALAHEVKAPLAAIRGAAELLTEDLPAAQREKFLGNIRSEGARIQQIVDRLLELSSLEARKALQQTEVIDVPGLMNEAAEVLRPACAGATVTLALSPATATLRGERVLLREAMVNLLQNALDFSPAGGTVSFAATLTDGRAAFTVEDGGPGVPDYALPRVFERFYSLPRPGTGRKSTGLGLALVREIALLHGGDIALANRHVGGAIATLWLPVKA